MANKKSSTTKIITQKLTIVRYLNCAAAQPYKQNKPENLCLQNVKNLMKNVFVLIIMMLMVLFVLYTYGFCRF